MKLHAALIAYLKNRQNSLCFLLCLLLGSATAAFAAGSRAAASTLPKDPAALLALAAQHNGLAGSGLKPWHIEAAYQLYDAKGRPTEQGTFDEWWEAPNEYKVNFRRPGYHIEIVANAKGIFVSGNDALPYPEYLVRHLFLHPATQNLPGKKMKLHFNEEKFGKARLYCVEEIPKGLEPTGSSNLNPSFPTYCMEPSQPKLRIYGSYGQSLVQVTNVGSLEGRYLPFSAIVFDSGKKYLSVNLKEVESAPQWNSSLFTASVGARPDPNFFNISKESAKVIAGNRISGREPIYPESPKEDYPQGAVSLSALIGQDGSVDSLIVTAASTLSLADSALAAFKTWKYKPYLLKGRPVKVQTTIRVIYTLG